MTHFVRLSKLDTSAITVKRYKVDDREHDLPLFLDILCYNGL